MRGYSARLGALISRSLECIFTERLPLQSTEPEHGGIIVESRDLALVLASGAIQDDGEPFPLDRLRMQKAVFLVSMRGTDRLKLLYSFVPYNWGPYSSSLAMHVDDLIRRNELTVKPAPRSQYGRYETTPIGETHAHRVWNELAQGERDFLKAVRSYVTHKSFNELLREVYAAYPDYATKSKFSG